MKAIRNALTQLDLVTPIAIQALERRQARLANTQPTISVLDSDDDANPGSTAENTADVDGDNMGPPVGTVVFKFFPFYGKFKGRVEMLRPNAENGKCIRVRFEDGDMEDMTLREFRESQEEASIPIGEVGFKFIKKFQGDWYTGEVIRVMGNLKRLCRFNDGDHKEYTLAQV